MADRDESRRCPPTNTTSLLRATPRVCAQKGPTARFSSGAPPEPDQTIDLKARPHLTDHVTGVDCYVARRPLQRARKRARSRRSRVRQPVPSRSACRAESAGGLTGAHVGVGVDLEDRQIIAVLVDQVRERRHAYRALAANRGDAGRFVFGDDRQRAAQLLKHDGLRFDAVALVGMHDWTDPMLPAIADQWGLRVFSPDTLRSSSAPLLDWLGDTGATKVAIHFDVDTIDADEIQLGLGADLGGLTTAEARRVVADIDGAAKVIALTIAEFIPRQMMHLQQILAGFPLLGPKA